MVWVQFVICLAIIIGAGCKLAKYGDFIAEKTGLERVWIGIVLLAAVTSFPKLATGVTSVTFVVRHSDELYHHYRHNIQTSIVVTGVGGSGHGFLDNPILRRDVDFVLAGETGVGDKVQLLNTQFLKISGGMIVVSKLISIKET